jgi:hypothetical protein
VIAHVRGVRDRLAKLFDEKARSLDSGEVVAQRPRAQNAANLAHHGGHVVHVHQRRRYDGEVGDIVLQGHRRGVGDMDLTLRVGASSGLCERIGALDADHAVSQGLEPSRDASFAACDVERQCSRRRQHREQHR